METDTVAVISWWQDHGLHNLLQFYAHLASFCIYGFRAPHEHLVHQSHPDLRNRHFRCYAILSRIWWAPGSLLDSKQLWQDGDSGIAKLNDETGWRCPCARAALSLYVFPKLSSLPEMLAQRHTTWFIPTQPLRLSSHFTPESLPKTFSSPRLGYGLSSAPFTTILCSRQAERHSARWPSPCFSHWAVNTGGFLTFVTPAPSMW